MVFKIIYDRGVTVRKKDTRSDGAREKDRIGELLRIANQYGLKRITSGVFDKLV